MVKTYLVENPVQYQLVAVYEYVLDVGKERKHILRFLPFCLGFFTV